MSGGHFQYEQYRLHDIAESIQELIAKNNVPDEEDGWVANYEPKTIAEFKKAVEFLRIAETYTQRIDWLVSGDDGEDTFHRRLKEELQNDKAE